MFAKIDGGPSVLSANSITSTGTIAINAGTLALASRADTTLGGTITGAGVLQLNSGLVAFQTGLQLSTGGMTIAGARLEELGSLTYAGNWTQTSGTLIVEGTSTVLTLSGQVSLGAGTINSVGAAGGTFRIVGNGNLSSFSSAARRGDRDEPELRGRGRGRQRDHVGGRRRSVRQCGGERFAGTVAGFAAGNVIELTGMAFLGASLSFDVGKLTVTNGSTSVGVQMSGTYFGGQFPPGLRQRSGGGGAQLGGMKLS